MAWTTRTKPSASWSTRTKPAAQAEVDFVFSDAADFLFSDSTDYVFLESASASSWTVRTKITN